MGTFDISPKVLRLCHDISVRLEFLDSLSPIFVSKAQRQHYTAGLVFCTLSSENTLTLDDVKALQHGIQDKKLHCLSRMDVLEVPNALFLYNQLQIFDPYNMKTLIDIYRILTKDIVPATGFWDSILDPTQKKNHSTETVLDYTNKTYASMNHGDLSLLVKACIYPYHLRATNIFGPWNENVARAVLRRILWDVNPVFKLVCLRFKSTKIAYETNLKIADETDNGTPLLEYYLETILEGILCFTEGLLERKSRGSMLE